MSKLINTDSFYFASPIYDNILGDRPEGKDACITEILQIQLK